MAERTGSGSSAGKGPQGGQRGAGVPSSSRAASSTAQSSVAQGRAERATGGQHGAGPGRAGPGRAAPPVEQGDEYEGQGQEFDQGDGHDQGGGGELAFVGGGRGGVGRGDHGEIFGNLKRTLLKQSLLWHARAIGEMLGIDTADIVEVLGEVADDLAGT